MTLRIGGAAAALMCGETDALTLRLPRSGGHVFHVGRRGLRSGPGALHDHAAAWASHLRVLAFFRGRHPALELGLTARRVAEVDAERHSDLRDDRDRGPWTLRGARDGSFAGFTRSA